MIFLTMVAGLFGLVFIGVPIAVALGLVGVVAMYWSGGADALLNLPIAMFGGAESFPLLAIPLFIIAGNLMNTGGISHRLIAFASALLGFIRGGLAMVNVGASMFFAEISGSAVADVAALGSVLIPAMKRRGYPGPFAAAVTSSSASIAIIIPPSISMILYAVMAESSVVQLFVAGIVPGFIAGGGMMLLSYWFARRYGFPVEEAFELRKLGRTFREAWIAFTLPLIILGGIFGGLVTATEGAALAVAAALFIGFVVYRELNWATLRTALVDAGMQTSVVMLMVATSAVVGIYLTEARLPQQLAAQMLALTQDRYAILALLNLLFLVLGFFLHGAAAIILVVPVVMPLVKLIGIDPVHFGIIVTLNLAIGQQTPPVASVLMTACSIAREDIWAVTRWNVWFVGVLLAVLLLVTYLPPVPMTLVRLFYG